MNISIIFIHVIGNLTSAHCIEKGLTAEQSYKIAEELGNNIYETIKLGTGIDSKKYFDKT